MAGCSLVVGVARVMQRRRAIQGRVEVLPCRLAARVIPATAGSEMSHLLKLKERARTMMRNNQKLQSLGLTAEISDMLVFVEE
ncbi:unnamed protein product [Urochloa humidicola]